MPRASYKVRFPVPDSDKFEEYLFAGRPQICDFMQIPMATFNAILNNKLTYKHANHRHLKGITIEKLDANIKQNEPIGDDFELKQKNYLNSLIQKHKQLHPQKA